MVALHAGPRPFWRIFVSERRVPSVSKVIVPSPDRRVLVTKTKRVVRGEGAVAAAAGVWAAGAGGGAGVAPHAHRARTAIVDETRIMVTSVPASSLTGPRASTISR